ncbi:hypothetical protein GDO86_005584 [Hymenochirus boettgeri]|uniref:Biopterin-dependent aromatic amino acid hydroxylase family profile domain-containing protein n=1 Tax=Hymenochirus boettgeri TaxID=247094 RepID=A0A8T2J733_9PIPI|nr:hypothetical protein GDO86_005584 [Hymenochirus boettgeri]
MKAEVRCLPCAQLPGRKRSLMEGVSMNNGITGESARQENKSLKRDCPDDCISTLNLIFSVKNPGTSGLTTSLDVLQKFEAQIHHIETRPAGKSKIRGNCLECFVQCDIPSSSISLLATALANVADEVKTIKEETFPSFPRKLQDLDKCHHLIVKYDPSLDPDHPGFGDQNYKKRRAFFTKLAFNYKIGDLLPRVDYTAEETETWRQIYKTLRSLYADYACKQYLDALHLLEEYNIFRDNSIPQLQEVSGFLKERTGFTLRPTAGLLSARDFLACLAFRDIGLASLGVSDVDIKKLSTLYWFTVEFGLCKQNGSIKAYGAGLLSSYGELLYALTNEPVIRPFDPEVTAVQPYQDASFQPVYFVSENFEDSIYKLRQYAMKMKRPFSIQYDSFTSSIEVIDSLQKVKNSLKHMEAELSHLCFALDSISYT